jgi:TorA maturation chaperone TorD/DNA-binding transcriptional regulator YdaS (Cro superfamily)
LKSCAIWDSSNLWGHLKSSSNINDPGSHRIGAGKDLREQGLQQAIDAAGGIAALARRLGIAQPSVSNWTRVPADRVVSVETLTGVPRSALRPDLYATEDKVIDEVDAARRREYLMLGSLLRQAPSAALLREISRLQGDASTLGLLHMSLAEAADATDADVESREFFRLFVGVGRGELLPYGSYYLTGFLHERPLARVREDMKRLGVERAEGLFEPEDHLGILFEVMAGLAGGDFGSGDDDQAAFFKRHLQPFAARVFSDLESAAKTDFYKAMARVGAAFVAIETEAFALPA